MKKYISQIIQGLFIIFAIYLLHENAVLKQQIAAQSQEISAAQAELKSARTVYVYSLEEAMVGISAADKKEKFRQEVVKLNDEVMSAEKKIKSLKDKDVKEDFSDVYLNSLRLKRDNLVEEYQNMLEELRDKVNNGLDEIATEKNVNAIFLKSSVAVMTPYVVDVTPELVEKLKK